MAETIVTFLHAIFYAIRDCQSNVSSSFFFNNYQISRRNGFLINNATGIWDYIVMMIGDLFAEE